jgi:hypothetical protein
MGATGRLAACTTANPHYSNNHFGCFALRMDTPPTLYYVSNTTSLVELEFGDTPFFDYLSVLVSRFAGGLVDSVFCGRRDGRTNGLDLCMRFGCVYWSYSSDFLAMMSRIVLLTTITFSL